MRRAIISLFAVAALAGCGDDDGTVLPDAGTGDAAAPIDAAPPAPDAGPPDGGPMDAGPEPDAGPPEEDAGMDVDAGPVCSADDECDDGIWCNGDEICVPTIPSRTPAAVAA